MFEYLPWPLPALLLKIDNACQKQMLEMILSLTKKKKVLKYQLQVQVLQVDHFLVANGIQICTGKSTSCQ